MNKAIYHPNFLTNKLADASFDWLWNHLNWERRDDAPRREFWTNDFNRDYTYGRGAGIRTYAAQPSNVFIEDIRTHLMNETGVWFEGCFINGYENNRDWLGWHADDDLGIDHNKPIAIVTLYGGPGIDRPRIIQFKNMDNSTLDYGKVDELELHHGSLALMPAGFQDNNQHRIPKAGFESKARISLTFRGLLV